MKYIHRCNSIWDDDLTTRTLSCAGAAIEYTSITHARSRARANHLDIYLCAYRARERESLFVDGARVCVILFFRRGSNVKLRFHGNRRLIIFFFRFLLHSLSVACGFFKLFACTVVENVWVSVFDNTSSVNARSARRIVGQSNFTCPFQIDQSQSLEVTISSPSLFCIGSCYGCNSFIAYRRFGNTFGN